jgi:hypothetical protein
MSKYPRRTLLDRDGELHLFFFNEYTDIYHVKTIGKRCQWGRARKILDGHIGAIRAVTQLADGRMVLAYHRRGIQGEALVETTGRSATTAVYSDNGGETWVPSQNLVTAPVYPDFNGNNYGACEPAILELQDGRLWLLMRSQTGYLWEAYSNDRGERWGQGRASIFRSSNSPAGFLRLPDGRIVLAWNNCREADVRSFGQIYTNRDVLHAAISEDDGQTWQGFREVFRDVSRDHQIGLGRGDHGTAYPNMVFTKQGKVILVSGQRDGLRAVFLFDPDFLYETVQEEDFSGDLERWCAYTFTSVDQKPERRPGPRLVTHPDKPSEQVLFLNRRDDHFPDAASWNFPMGRKGEVELNLLLQPGADAVIVALTDHFRYPNDPEAEAQGMFSFQLDESLLEVGKWHRLTLRWDLLQEHCVLLHQGRLLTFSEGRRDCLTGISYLRLRYLAEGVNENGIMISQVRAVTTQNLSLNARW